MHEGSYRSGKLVFPSCTSLKLHDQVRGQLRDYIGAMVADQVVREQLESGAASPPRGVEAVLGRILGNSPPSVTPEWAQRHVRLLMADEASRAEETLSIPWKMFV